MTRVMLESGIGPLGELVFASSMVGVDPRDRPRVRCPECDDLLTFKAGERGIVTPHVAHRSGSACAATNPETAAHFNAKMLLTRVLNTSGTLRLRTKCYRAGHHVEADWHVPAWQRAEAEFRVETRRPDVAVFGEGDAVVGAVEVLHTHRVDRRKASDYAASGLPWVEFRAEHVLAWDGKGALPVEAADRETLRELMRSCAGCRAMYTPPSPPPNPEEIARQVAAFRAALEKLRLEKERARQPAQAEATAPPDRQKEWLDHRERCREADARRAELMARPPSLKIAVGVAMDGNPGFAVAGAVVMKAGAAVNLCEVGVSIGSGEAGWLALEHALDLVESRAGGRPATIYTNFSTADKAHVPMWPADDHGSAPIRRRVKEALDRTGSLIVWAGTKSNINNPEAAEWIIRVHREAKARVLGQETV